MTRDLLILQFRIRWNLKNIGVTVVPPGVAPVFSILQNPLHVQITENIASQQRLLPVETVLYVQSKEDIASQ